MSAAALRSQLEELIAQPGAPLDAYAALRVRLLDAQEREAEEQLEELEAPPPVQHVPHGGGLLLF